MLQTTANTFLRYFHICCARINRKETAKVHTFGSDKVYSVQEKCKILGVGEEYLVWCNLTKSLYHFKCVFVM